MKKIISVLISISLLLMSVPAFAISGTGTESNPYLISSASDIAKIHNDLDGYYKLTTNINMYGVDFEPIGNEYEGSFTGTIDGVGYTISNLNINLPDNKYVGFVGYLEGTVKNLNIANVNAYGYRYVGGIVGYAEEGSEIYSCSVSGTVGGEYRVIDLNVGGIVGCSYADISDCISDSDVEGNGGKVGGIVGYSYATILNCKNNSTVKGQYSGGIVGYNNNEVINSINTGIISGDTFAGGIAGCNRYNSMITNCTSKGSVSDCNRGGISGINYGTIQECVNFANLNGNSSVDVGGIAGRNEGIISSCVNNCDIDAKCGTLGGIVGYNTSIVTNSINNGAIVGGGYSGLLSGHISFGGIVGENLKTVTNCQNDGTVTGKSGSGTKCVGGISGKNRNQGTITNCSNYNTIYSSDYAGGIAGYNDSDASVPISNCLNIGNTSGNRYGLTGYGSLVYNCYQLADTRKHNGNILTIEEFSKSSSFAGFDFNDIWYTDSTVHNGIPQLKNMPEHLVLNKCIAILEVGDSTNLWAYVDGNDESVTWVSSDNSIATISSNGQITAKSIGICSATATNSEGMKANCLIYVYGKATSLKLTDNEIYIDRNSSQTISFVQSPGSANEAVMWYSEDESVAKVSQSGVVTGVTKGKTTIYAISVHSKLRDDCVVNVASPITNLSLPSSKTIKIGDGEMLVLSVSPSEYEGSITWSSSDEEIATVDQDGMVTAHKLGTTTIKVESSNGKIAQCELIVNQPATSIKLNKTAITTYVGSTYQLSATLAPFDCTDTVTWTSSSTSYVTVTSTGLIKGIRTRSGTITITATTSSGLTATCYVTVKAAQVMPTSVTLSDTYITLAPEDAKALTPTFEPSNTTETTLTWTSSDESVATVDKNGVVTAVSNGFATIRGKTANGLTSECVVKVVSATGTSVLLDNTKASPGGTAQVKANIIKNPGLSAYRFKVNYDADILTPVSITPNAEFGGTFSTNLEDADRTELNVLWYSGNDDVVANGELFTVNFKVNDSAAYGDSSIVSIEYGATDICDTSGNYIAIYTEDATVSITDPRPGDIYEDSDVNVYDLTLLARYITSLETFTERQEEAADVNNDERVDILDVIRLAQYLVNWSGIELMSLDLYDEPTTPVISVGSASVNELNEAEIPVYIKNNSGILGYRFVLDYNAEDIELLSITPSELINKDGFNHNLGAESQATDGLVVSCFASGNNITDDGILFTIKVRYKNPADTSVSPISVVDSFDNMGNENATYVTATYETGYALGSDYIVANKVVGDTNFSCELYFDDSYAEQSAKAIIAFYDGDGRMVQLMPKDITVKPGKVDLSIDYDKKAYTTYKLMIWEGMGSLKPITEVK